MGQGKLTNLLKETETGLFRANKKLKEASKLAKEIEAILQSLAQAEQASSGKPEAEKGIAEQIQKTQVVGQSRELFRQLDSLRKSIQDLEELQSQASSFVERYRTGRLYSFQDSRTTVKFARQLLETFSSDSILFKPRYVGTLDLGEVAEKLKLKRGPAGLLLQPKDLKPFVSLMSEKKFASNISLEAQGIKLQWQDKKTISVVADAETLYRADMACDVLQGKCIEK